MQHKWQAQLCPGGHWYARRFIVIARRKVCVLMHRIVIDAPSGLQVDHINGDGLDNRRSNLRLATASQNQMNRGCASHNTSGYKGVRVYRYGHGWIAQIVVKGKSIHLGTFSTPEMAAKAYDEAAKKMQGDFRRANLH